MDHPPAPWRLFGELILIPGPRVMLANYTSGTLVYHELIVFDRALRIRHIYVDDEQSLRGGRAIWGVPKQLATFTYTRTRFSARQGDTPLLDARIRRRRGVIPLVLPAPIRGVATGRAAVKAAPALVRIEDHGPFAELAGTHLALAGDDLRLTIPGPS